MPFLPVFRASTGRSAMGGLGKPVIVPPNSGAFHMHGERALIGVLAPTWGIGLGRAAEPKPESLPPPQRKSASDDYETKDRAAETPAPINPTEVWQNLWADHADYAGRVDALYPVRAPWPDYPLHFYAEG